MGRLKIAPFTTRDDFRIAQLRPASREVGSWRTGGGGGRVWQAKGSSDQEGSKLDHGHSRPKPPKDRLVEQLQALQPAARLLHT